MSDTGWNLLGDLWTWNPAMLISAAAFLAILVAGAVLLVRGARNATGNVKLKAGTTLVQAGVTWAVVTGTYAYCANVLDLPEWEAAAFAVFLEAATWVTVGMIIAHGRTTNDKGEPNTGMGPAAPFFWLFSILGGVLATIAGETPGAMLGRAIIVAFGACLWYLTLLTHTRPSAAPSRFRWTPRRFLVMLGAIEPADQDVTNEHEEWQIRRLARAMRWANGRVPLRWIGQRALIARAEQTDEDVIESARRRYAVAHLLITTVRPDSDVMQRVIAAVKADAVAGSPAVKVADLVADTPPAPKPEPAPAPTPRPMPALAAATPRPVQVHVPAEKPTEVTTKIPRVPAKQQRSKSEAAEEYVLGQWDKGLRPTGADVQKAVLEELGVPVSDSLGRKTLQALREAHPGREPGTNGAAVPELVGAR